MKWLFFVMSYTNSDFKNYQFEKTINLNSTNKLFKQTVKLHVHRSYHAKAGAHLYIFKHLVIILFIRYTPTYRQQYAKQTLQVNLQDIV